MDAKPISGSASVLDGDPLAFVDVVGRRADPVRDGELDVCRLRRRPRRIEVTGAVVGQQPFGGSRASGTNDKAGSYLNLIRWTSQRTIKENFVPPKHFSYPFMGEE